MGDELPGFDSELELGRGLSSPSQGGLQPWGLVEGLLCFHQLVLGEVALHATGETTPPTLIMPIAG